MKSIPLTIRARLSILFAASTVLILVSLSVFIYLFTRDYRQREFRQRMEVRLQEADSLLRKNAAYPFMTLDRLPPGTLPEEAFYYRRPEARVTVPEENADVDLTSLASIEKERFYFLEKDGRSYLLHFDKALGHVIILSAVDVFGYTKLKNLKKILLLGILFGSLAMGFISWYLPKKELKPLSEKIRKARAIGGESLNLRLEARNPNDELGQLAMTFNDMLDRIERAFETQKQFSSNAAHELRNPITAISGEAQLALMQQRSEADYRKALDRIRDKSMELEKMVDRLLILSRIESKRMEKNEVRVDEVLLASIASVIDRYPGKDQQLQITIDETSSDHYLVRGDGAMLQLAFSNVVENALKYGAGRPVQVSLALQASGMQLEIADQGMGITEEEREKVFELFYRTQGVRHIRGSGIGLSLVKSIVEWHGGTIQLDSNRPSGLRVCMQLPAAG